MTVTLLHQAGRRPILYSRGDEVVGAKPSRYFVPGNKFRNLFLKMAPLERVHGPLREHNVLCFFVRVFDGTDISLCRTGGVAVFSGLDRGYVLVSEGFGDVHLMPAGDKHFNLATGLCRYYAGDEPKDVPSIFLWTLI